MSEGGFAFLPRKVARPSNKSAPKASAPFTYSAANTVRKASNVDLDAAIHVGNSDTYDQNSLWKGKQPENTKYLEDSTYLALLELALSDYALWADTQLMELIESDSDGFVPLSYVMRRVLAFSGLDSLPPVSVLMRCIKSSPRLEGRMMVVDPDGGGWMNQTGTGDEGGGFEVRRLEWAKARERIRRSTAFQWEYKTIYVENLPHYARTVASVHAFISELLHSEASLGQGNLELATVQGILFPRHRDDPSDGPQPTKSKGFAFIVLAHTKHVDYLLQNWPWDIDERPSMSGADPENEKASADALDFGFRCLAKKTWDNMKKEYLALQQRLLEETLEAGRKPHTTPFSNEGLTNDSDKIISTRDRPAEHSLTPSGPKHSPRNEESTYPTGCLLFVKNVSPETNKTTLRMLFSSALGGNATAIDYVDFNKGLDSCHLRLANSTYADAIVNHFSAGKLVQNGALDNVGAPSASHSKLPLLEVELVSGKKEEMYWDKVPEKIRMQALTKAQMSSSNLEDAPSQDDVEGRKRPKRRKR